MNDVICPLCHIGRSHQRGNRDACGEHYGKPGCLLEGVTLSEAADAGTEHEAKADTVAEPTTVVEWIARELDVVNTRIEEHLREYARARDWAKMREDEMAGIAAAEAAVSFVELARFMQRRSDAVIEAHEEAASKTLELLERMKPWLRHGDEIQGMCVAVTMAFAKVPAR